MLKNNERLISITGADGKNYFIYFTGTTHYDEDNFGRPVERENFQYLDENFNRWIFDGKREDIGRHYSVIDKMARQKGRTVFVGPHAPETETVDGDYVPNENDTTLGIWEKAEREEILKFKSLLIKQNKERQAIKLA